MTRIVKAKDRLLEVLDRDRKELASSQDAPADASKDEPSAAERFTKNLALIQAYEARKGG
jgi:hypothetical protein